MPLSNNPSENFDPVQILEELGFTFGEDGVIRGTELHNCTIGLPDQNGVVLITTPDGQEFKLSGVKGVDIQKMSVSGKGSVGIKL